MRNIYSYFTTIIAAAAILTLAGCHKDNPDDPQPARLKVSATLDVSAVSRVTIEKGDGIIDAKWQANDAISGFWKDGGTVCNLSYKVSEVTADGKGAHFTLTSGQEPSTDGTVVYLAYVSKELGTLAFNSDGCAQLTFTTQDGSFDGLAKNIVFCAQAAVAAGELKLKFNPSTALVDIKKIAGIGSGETIKSISVDSNTGMGGGVLRVENGNLSLCPADKAMPVVINCTSPEGAIWFTSCPTAQPMDFVVSTVSGDKFGDYRKRVSRPLTAGECVDVKTLSVNEGGLSGVFSVSETDKVRFTCGNLTARRSGGALTWGFATKQYDGASDGLVDVEADGVFQHFCWSTVKTNWGLYKSISDDRASQGGATDFYATDKGWSELFTGQYRLLKDEEWTYILDSRSVTERFFKAKVNDTQGLVLLPDSFSWPEGVSSPGDGVINEKGSLHKSVRYDCGEFDKLEANGAVFLPSAGIREEGQIVRVDSGMGIYRSLQREDGGDYDYTKPLLFDDEKVIIENNDGINLLDLWRGLCVRLVKDQL